MCDYDGYTTEAESCQTCDGQGYVVDCWDDLCQNGECIHGDGYRTCPDCGGSGEVDMDEVLVFQRQA